MLRLEQIKIPDNVTSGGNEDTSGIITSWATEGNVTAGVTEDTRQY